MFVNSFVLSIEQNERTSLKISILWQLSYRERARRSVGDVVQPPRKACAGGCRQVGLENPTQGVQLDAEKKADCK